MWENRKNAENLAYSMSFQWPVWSSFLGTKKGKTRKYIENHDRFYGGAPHSKFLFCSKYSEGRNFEWAAF